jgi:hypothetical protein
VVLAWVVIGGCHSFARSRGRGPLAGSDGLGEAGAASGGADARGGPSGVNGMGWDEHPGYYPPERGTAGSSRCAPDCGVGGVVDGGVEAGAGGTGSSHAGAGASADEPLHISHQAAVVVDDDVHWWNQSSANWDKLVTYGDYQFVVYWDAENASGDVLLVIKRRHLPTGNLQTFEFDPEAALRREWLPMNDTALGISPDGRVHVTYDQHGRDHHYAMSNVGCAGQSDFAACSFSTQYQTADASEAKLAYPIYFNDSKGNLYFAYRSGSVVNGDEHLNRYNNDGTWTHVGIVLNGKSGGTYSAAGFTSTTRGPYVDGFCFDSSGRLHVMYTWREQGLPGGDTLAQHDIYYVYSDDFGVTWKNRLGNQVAELPNDPVQVTDADTVAIAVDFDWWRTGAGRMALDSNGQPHLVVPQSDVKTQSWDAASMRQAHFWQTMDGVWHEAWVEPASLGNHAAVRGSLFFDRGDNAYYIYAVNALGWFAWNDPNVPGQPYNNVLPDDHVTWQGGDFLNVKLASLTTALVTREPINIPIGTSVGASRNVVIRMENLTAATEAKIYFTTNPISEPEPAWSTANSKTFALQPGWATYTISMAPLAGWTGTLRNMELDPALGVSSGELNIDYIRITDDAGSIAEAWEFQQGARLVAAGAEPTNNWRTWRTYDILPGVSVSYGAESFSPDVGRYRRPDKMLEVPVLEQGAPGLELLTVRQFDIIQDDVAKQWFFATDRMGWTALNQVSSFDWVSDDGKGSLQGTFSGSDSQIVSANDLNVDLSVTDEIWVKMKRSAGSKAKICWAVNGSATFANCSQQFDLIDDLAYHNYRISTAGFAGWHNQTLTRLRLDPSDTADVTSGTFTIDSVRILELAPP